jgi:phenylalanyl-tRNA synthetase beta chain
VKIQFSWLREFVNVPGSPESVAQTMSVRGFALEGIERLVDDDAVLDFEITANRPDCLSLVGMAREVATAYDLPLTIPVAADSPHAGSANDKPTGIDVVIENPDLCSRYVGAIADITVTPSPGWMQARLLAAGATARSSASGERVTSRSEPMPAPTIPAAAKPQVRRGGARCSR